MKSLSLFLAGALAMAPMAALAQPTAMYVRDAGASDLFERQSAMTVLQSTHNPQIRSFAEKMIRDHTRSTDMVKTAAMRAHMHVGTPHHNPDQSQMLARLRAARGADRDRLYVEQQRTSHDQALQVQQDYANSGRQPALRRAASNIVPVVQQHIALLQQMNMDAPAGGHTM